MAITEDKRVWGIHTTDDTLFLNKNVIAIGWREFGDCSLLEPTREAYVDLILKYYDQLSEKYRKMIPLKMVYIPVSETE